MLVCDRCGAPEGTCEHQWEQGMTFTCDQCRDSGFCRWAYDSYNINGDCLGSK